MTDSGITLVDANILIDILGPSPAWAAKAEAAVDRACARGELAINPLIFAEVCAGMDRYEIADAALSRSMFLREDLPWDAAFLAGKAFAAYRRRGGARRSPLPNFYIGAHAAVRGHRLLTRDAARYRTYFPTVELLMPA